MNGEDIKSLKPRLRIHLLGDFGIFYDAQPVEGIASSRVQELLAYLLMHQNTPQSRYSIAFRFWPDSTESQALTNLRNILYYLRRAVPDADLCLEVDKRTLQWRSDALYTCDINDFDRTLKVIKNTEKDKDLDTLLAVYENLVNIYTGDLLPTCYEDWILLLRENYRLEFMTNLKRYISLLEEKRQYDAAIENTQRMLKFDPLHEQAYRQLMRLYTLNGNRAAAVRTYHSCATTLQRELAVEPDPRTQEAYERLVQSETKIQPQKMPQVALKTAIPLFGREREWKVLRQTYHSCAEGGSRMVLISGEVGIGKTRLAEQLLTWTDKQGISSAVARCYGAEGDLPFAPVAAWLRSLPQPHVEEIWLTEASRIVPELRPVQLAPPMPSKTNESWLRQRLFEALARLILSIKQPLVLFLDDLQWCDHDTLEWLHYLLRYDKSAQLLVIGTLRVENLPDCESLVILLDALRCTDQVVEIELAPLNRKATYSLAEYLAEQKLDPVIAQSLYQESEGNPFYIVEIVRSGLSREQLYSAEIIKPTERTAYSIPPKVRIVIEARLAQLSKSAREMAGLAAIIGREFTLQLLVGVSDSGESDLIHNLDELWRRRIIREQGTVAYDFSHSLIRNVAYDALSSAQRRILHQRIAFALASSDVEGSTIDPVYTALHFECAGLTDKAIYYYQQAGERSQRSYASEEAVRYFKKALVLLKELPSSIKRDRQELILQLTLGVPLIYARGHAFPEVESIYRRALALCDQAGDAQLRFQALNGLRRYYLVHGEMPRALEIGEKMIVQGTELHEPTYLSRAHLMHGETLWRMGLFSQARDHLAIANDLYNPVIEQEHTLHYGTDTGVGSLIFGAIALCFLGYYDTALRTNVKGMELAFQVDHPYTNIVAFLFTALLHLMLRNVPEMKKVAESIIQLGTEYGFTQFIFGGKAFLGWVLVHCGNASEGIQLMEQAINGCKSIGSLVDLGQMCMNLADSYLYIGETGQAHTALTEAFNWTDQSRQCCWEAELHRLTGEYHLQLGEQNAAEAAFQNAIRVSRQQEARMFELRATTSLCTLLSKQGNKDKARLLLQVIYSWFTEGFETADLIEAKMLLDTLL